MPKFVPMISSKFPPVGVGEKYKRKLAITRMANGVVSCCPNILGNPSTMYEIRAATKPTVLGIATGHRGGSSHFTLVGINHYQ